MEDFVNLCFCPNLSRLFCCVSNHRSTIFTFHYIIVAVFVKFVDCRVLTLGIEHKSTKLNTNHGHIEDITW